jgi:translation initiation factor IF-3
MIVLTCRTSVAGMVNRGKTRIIREACVLLARTIDVMSVLFIYREHRRITTHLVRRCFAIANKELQINEEIRDKEVRVIGADGEQLGIMSSRDAYNMAQEKSLDLVKIAPQAQPPVCRIMDYGKYRFEQAKREKESRKNQKTIEVKETRLSLNIDTHDFDTKVNQTKKFLASGNRVKVSIRFRGREMAHSQLGYGIMQRFAEACADAGNVEKPAKLEGRSMIMFMNAKPAPANKQ